MATTIDRRRFLGLNRAARALCRQQGAHVNLRYWVDPDAIDRATIHSTRFDLESVDYDGEYAVTQWTFDRVDVWSATGRVRVLMRTDKLHELHRAPESDKGPEFEPTRCAAVQGALFL